MVRMLALVVCLLVSSSAFAQEFEVVRTPLQTMESRTRDGAVQTPTARLPALTATEVQRPPVVDEVICEVTMPDAVYEDPRTQVTMWLYKFEASYGGWRRMGGGTFRGIPGGYVDEDGTGAVAVYNANSFEVRQRPVG